VKSAKKRLVNRRGRDVVLSFPHPQPAVALIGRPGVRIPVNGFFAGHYKILPDSTRLTVMPAANWLHPNNLLANEIAGCLKTLLNCAGADCPVSPHAGAN
jgi:hypothetical protein